MSRLEGTTAATTENVRQVQKTFDQAASNVPLVTTDVLRIHAIPDGAWTRVSPFRRYRVTDEVKETVKRAMKAVDDTPKNKIFGALARVQAQAQAEGKDKDGMRARRFREELYAACPKDARDLLGQWMPLIIKVSRIPE